MSMDLNQAFVFPISNTGNHRHMQSLVGMRMFCRADPPLMKVLLQHYSAHVHSWTNKHGKLYITICCVSYGQM